MQKTSLAQRLVDVFILAGLYREVCTVGEIGSDNCYSYSYSCV